jgi:hypothetical protein
MPTDRTSGPESAAWYLANRVKWVAEFGKFKQFQETRAAILAGEDLFDCSKTSLAARGLMGPLTFNLYETALAAMPGLALQSIVGFLVPDFVVPDDAAPLSSSFDAAAADVTRLLIPFLVPTCALLLAWVAAWASLNRGDRTRSNLRRARDAYLYYDGAHGLVPEMLTSFWYTAFGAGAITGGMFVAANLPTTIQTLLIALNYIVGFVAWYHLIGEQLKGIPSLLFATNGYDITPPGDSIRMLDEMFRTKERASWRQYRIAIVAGTPIVIGVAVVAFTVAALTGGALLYWLRNVIAGATPSVL